ncbi:MAG: hypothetical protein V4508_23660 [Pseudomonadota bacterium]
MPCTDRDFQMTLHQQPSKERVRQWLSARIAQRRPPPEPQQIRRELGWALVHSTHCKR